MRSGCCRTAWAWVERAFRSADLLETFGHRQGLADPRVNAALPQVITEHPPHPSQAAAPPPLPGSGCGCDRGIRLAGTALARPSVHAMRARCQCLGGLRTWSATVAQSAVGPLNTSSGRHLHVQPSMSPCAYPTPGIPPFITRRSHRQDEWKIVTA